MLPDTDLTPMSAPLVAVRMIKPSPHNPRKHFDEPKLRELADSILAHGILQPLIVRIHGEGYEIVAGERRFRAAQLLGMTAVPAMIIDCDDRAAAEKAMIENRQRDDLTPLEEADALAALHGRHGVPVEELAAKLGLSKPTIYGRLKLADADVTVREALMAGTITASVALMIARLTRSDHEAAVAIAHQCHPDQLPQSQREVARHLDAQLLRDFADAPFPPDDATLVKAAGSCGDCPKRTKNDPGLFADFAERDRCLDGSCWNTKVEADWKRRAADHKKAGGTVLSTKETAKVFVYSGIVPTSGFVELNGDEIDRVEAKQVTLARDEHGELHHLVSAADAAKLRPTPKAKAPPPNEHAERQMADERQRNERVDRLIAAALGRGGLVRFLAEIAFRGGHADDATLKKFKLRRGVPFMTWVGKAAEDDLLHALVDDVVRGKQFDKFALEEIAAILGIPLDPPTEETAAPTPKKPAKRKAGG